VTTVGYGDVVPSEASGKVFAAILMIGGLSFLSIVTATITSSFVARRQAELRDAGHDPMMQKLEEISSRLDEIEGELRRSADRQDST
jgi:voltage-gated potassium channel